jgi:Domain of unknown function (DUF4166)
MRPEAVELEPVASDVVSYDLRFSALLGNAGWWRLPPPVRERFGKRLGAAASVTYAGEIVESRRTRYGHLLAQLCRLIGAPLPLYDDISAPAVVTVTEDAATGGQFWTRMYGRTHGFPQVVHSSKRFAGPTGLEEYLGCGFGIALTVSADTQALHFHSDHYFVACGPVRLRLPRWLEPGGLTISHIERGDGWFAFVLRLQHPLFGEVLRQTGMFRERTVRNGTDDPGGEPSLDSGLPPGRSARLQSNLSSWSGETPDLAKQVNTDSTEFESLPVP